MQNHFVHIYRVNRETGISEMEKQFSLLNHVSPFWNETSTGNKPANRTMNNNTTILPCEFITRLCFNFNRRDSLD